MMPVSAMPSDLARDTTAPGARTLTTIRRSMSTATIASVANDPVTEFDLGPLTWVQREIDQALTHGLELLDKYRASNKDVAALKDACLHVHQAAGAIRMVGLEAVAEFADEIERNLVHLEGLASPDIEAAGVVIERSCRKMSTFLGELASGAPPASLKLYPEYWAMQRSRGANTATPGDLFYPDLRTRAPRIALKEKIEPGKLHSYLAKKRRLYQSGLLSWLRGEAVGATTMREAIAGIEGITSRDNLRSFWWTVRALFEALADRGLESGDDVKQLAARIDLQIRRLVEGSAEAADRLRREVLYYVAISAPVGPTVRAVQRAFRLSALIPPADAINADVIGIEPLVREARERLASVKEIWLNFASGRAENLAKLKQTLALVHTKAEEIQHGALAKLTAALVERLDHMPPGTLPEPLAMEFTTALLLVERALEHHANLSPAFPQQVDTMLERLDAAVAGRTAPGDAAMLGELGKRAQERILFAQVGHEIQANLRRMEEVLDTFFRDNSKRTELASLTKDSSQIHGALRILGLDDADRLLALCDQQIEAYAKPQTEVVTEQLELLAESLCGLGFYFEAAERHLNGDRVLTPLLARWLGETMPEPAEEAESVEAAVAELRAELPQLLEAVHGGGNYTNARDELKRKLARLRDDAELIGDEELAIQADTAIAELELGGPALAAALGAITETSAPAPQVSAETRRLLEVGATELDAGLLDIYMSEAVKVLATIAEAHAALGRNSGDREALHAVRRGFHTLKESGRMVGLSELSEFAWEIEKIHSRLLEEKRPVTAAVFAMIDIAQASFNSWIDALRVTRRVVPDATKLHAALSSVESELTPVATAARALATPPSTVALDPNKEQPTSEVPTSDVFQAASSTRSVQKDMRHVALVRSASDMALASVHDEIDDQLLVIFFEDAAKLFPAAGEQLQAWRRTPRDEVAAEQLGRTLHAFKGSARMAGAMRLGQLAQVMESRVRAGKLRAAAMPDLFEALEIDLDGIAFVLDKLIAGESNVALPRLSAKSSAESEAAPRPVATSQPPAAPVAKHSIVVLAAPSASVSPAPPTAASKATATADACADSTVRVLRANLLDLAGSVASLRSQVSEIEIQTDAQMRSRMTELTERRGECDPRELDGLASFQRLTHSLAEAVRGLATVHAALLRNLDDADSARSPERGSPGGT